jgi:hypothetical protein
MQNDQANAQSRTLDSQTRAKLAEAEIALNMARAQEISSNIGQQRGQVLAVLRFKIRLK